MIKCKHSTGLFFTSLYTNQVSELIHFNSSRTYCFVVHQATIRNKKLLFLSLEKYKVLVFWVTYSIGNLGYVDS